MQISKALTSALAFTGIIQPSDKPNKSPLSLVSKNSPNIKTNPVNSGAVFAEANRRASFANTALHMLPKTESEDGKTPPGLEYIASTYPDVNVEDIPKFLYPSSSVLLNPEGLDSLQTLRPNLNIERITEAFVGVQVQDIPRTDGGSGFDKEFEAHIDMIRSHPAFTTFAGEEIANVQPQQEAGMPSIYEMSFKDDKQALHNHPHGPRMLVIHTGSTPAGVSFGGVRSPEEIKTGEPIELVRLNFTPNSTTFLSFPSGMMHAFSGRFYAQSIHALSLIHI